VSKVSWQKFIASARVVDVKIGGIMGILAEMRVDEAPLPNAWAIDVSHAYKVKGTELWARVVADAEGPGGGLLVDAVGIFRFGMKLKSVPDEYIQRFYAATAIPAVAPTTRATFNDTNVRMGLGAPHIGFLVMSDGELRVAEVPDDHSV